MTFFKVHTNFEQIKQFHKIFDDGYKDPNVEDRDRVLLRGKLMFEELQEVFVELGLVLKFDPFSGKIDVEHDDAFIGGVNRPRLAKELADLLYVTYGSADTMDIPIDEVFSVVHQSNMSKAGPDGKPIRREDGKILKGPNYKPADVKEVLDNYEQRKSLRKKDV